MGAWLTRVENELHELQDRINKLQSFLSSDRIQEITIAQKCLMSEQLYVMKQYENILKLRIMEGDNK